MSAEFKYVKDKKIVQANQWFKQGDHPFDACVTLYMGMGEEMLTEGKMVKQFNRWDENRAYQGENICPACSMPSNQHGFLPINNNLSHLGAGYIVCPGDWVIIELETNTNPYPVKPSFFQKEYQKLTR